MPKYILYFFLLAIVSLASCKFNPNLQGEGDAKLQGSWKEGDAPYQDQRLQYSKHQFRISCDSIYVTIQTFARVNTYPDNCFNEGQWTEYAKGVYSLYGDTLLLSTTFTKANFKQKISGCYRSGQYLASFIIRKNEGDILYLESLQQHGQLTMHRTSKTTCIQQTLN